uniref:Uncharacterized protein n=1 Tax=Myoviridae sp. ctshb19 TaxID=2825194 RepID=A0A8S5UGZ5_9CAUD|nr:MAG TPA: hypothetical protein [Myoviridae sp. ctshb19]
MGKRGQKVKQGELGNRVHKARPVHKAHKACKVQ